MRSVDSARRIKFPAGRSRSDAHAEVLDLEELVDAVLRALAAEAGLLHAAERRLSGRDQAGVDPDDAGLEALRDAPDPAEVAGVEVGGEPELGVVREANRFLLGLEAEERRDRSEGLLPDRKSTR